jgi:hypothetical protein
MSLGRRLLALITAVLAVTGVMAVSTGVAFGRDTTPVGEMSSYDRATHTALPRASVAMPPLASAHGAVAAWTNAGRGMPPPTPPVLGAEEGGGALGADDLSGAVQSNYGRFLKSIPSGAEEPTITQLPDGSVQFDANVPAANIPGSYATYTKVVDSEGNTVTFYKTTYAPDGSVVHVKVKFP